MTNSNAPPRRPRLRPLEAFPVRHEGEVRLALRDPEGLAPGVLVASPALAALLPLLDGTRDGAAISTAWRERTGGDLVASDLDDVLASLDESLLLEGARLDEARAARLATYRARARRPAVHAGEAYPETAPECAAFLDRHLAAAGDVALPATVSAVVAPHIDPRGGGPCHGAAARAIARSPAEVFVVLGTAHAPLRRPFALTTLDFDTPLGALPTDRDLVRRLARSGDGSYLDDELAHEGEHSVEFQALWIRHVHAGRPGVRIVPVLVGSLHERIRDGRSPLSDAPVAAFVRALREIVADMGERVALVASVDFAHVGPRYGHPSGPDAAALARVLEGDRLLLSRAAARDAEGWIRGLHEERDARNVCGAAPTYVLLGAISGGASPGVLLRHDAWEIDPDTGSHVTFAAMAFGA
jgi:AmmeMemoRadiSam system protein B